MIILFFSPDHLKYYYYMYYDEGGTVCEVRDECQRGG